LGAVGILKAPAPGMFCGALMIQNWKQEHMRWTLSSIELSYWKNYIFTCVTSLFRFTHGGLQVLVIVKEQCRTYSYQLLQ
jgi:hypothetical protein